VGIIFKECKNILGGGRTGSAQLSSGVALAMLHFHSDSSQFVRLLFKDDVSIEGGTRSRSCLKHYATSRKVAGSSRDVNFFSIYPILPAALWPWCRLSV
jgi:hypothetical protein